MLSQQSPSIFVDIKLGRRRVVSQRRLLQVLPKAPLVVQVLLGILDGDVLNMDRSLRDHVGVGSRCNLIRGYSYTTSNIFFWWGEE